MLRKPKLLKKKILEKLDMNKTKTLTFSEEQIRTAINYLILSKSTSASYQDYLKINEIIDLLENAPYNEEVNV